MSSELIGELGQVGLTIGQPRQRQMDDDGDKDVDLLSDVSSPHQSERKKPRYSNHKPKKFRSAWMMFDIFKDWLRPHASPEFATCIVCCRVIKAGKSELEKHATGKRHLRMLKIHKGGGQNSESKEASVENVENDSNSDSNFGGKVDHHCKGDSVDSSQNSADLLCEEPVISKAVVTRPAPHWKATAIVNGHVTKLDLNGYKGRYVILVFYCNDFSKVCSSEITALSDRLGEFRSLKTEIVACSTDSHLAHLVWVKTPRGEGGVANPKIPLLADPNHSIAKDYGVYLSEKGHALRSHFVIDRRGILRHMAVNDSLVGRGTDELLRLLYAFQCVDDTDEPLVADWTPNTMEDEEMPKKVP
ncbi:uncharacterized protein LOC106673485 [Cimex lectularius]|uniref:thioredoxin-dependent peroxiredoxin n=1 Tax=Cimex lectularius TaxID=79782 RepID=A0A8I6S984_CIMLE|nr:uncharacterized protein LOC106673485 [Cimex lectularius]XP_014261117.1 uncharacterized protein LOC106673485 [Cimex lectularius]